MHGRHLHTPHGHRTIWSSPTIVTSRSSRRAAIVGEQQLSEGGNCLERQLLESRCFEVSDVSELVYKVSGLTGQVLAGRH